MFDCPGRACAPTRRAPPKEHLTGETRGEGGAHAPCTMNGPSWWP
jgi:hypothetical protein